MQATSVFTIYVQNSEIVQKCSTVHKQHLRNCNFKWKDQCLSVPRKNELTKISAATKYLIIIQ